MTRAVTGQTAATAGAPLRYLGRAELPLVSLVFLLPFMIVYELGTRYFTTAAHHGRNEQIIAFSLLQQFFAIFGVSGRHLPVLAVIGVLMTWHIARKDPWEIDIRILFGMALESVALAVPLILMGYALPRYFPLAASAAQTDHVILAFGAGVYEEFFFRLAMFALLHLVFYDLLRVGRGLANLLVVAVSAFSFSAYHYLSPNEHFLLQTFVFRTLAGAYFGCVFLVRGFGITSASHCFYDIIVTALTPI